MRNIKFRAWDNKAKKWLLGYEYPNLGGFSMFGEVMLFEEWSRILSRFLLQGKDRTGEDLILMQNTGLQDKNGKEIYEGDIVKRGTALPLNGKIPNNKVCLPPIDKAVKVFYHDGEFKMSKNGSSKKFKINGLVIRMAGIEVVGNICETPELLTPQT